MELTGLLFTGVFALLIWLNSVTLRWLWKQKTEKREICYVNKKKGLDFRSLDFILQHRAALMTKARTYFSGILNLMS